MDSGQSTRHCSLSPDSGGCGGGGQGWILTTHSPPETEFNDPSLVIFIAFVGTGMLHLKTVRG